MPIIASIICTNENTAITIAITVIASPNAMLKTAAQ